MENFPDFEPPTLTAKQLRQAFLNLLAMGPPGPNPNAPYPTGANFFFCGHSFFVPVANEMDDLIEANDGLGLDDYEFLEPVFSGGASGSPQNLWDDPNDFVPMSETLATGKVDVFGLTTHMGPTVEEYQQWFDLALEHNDQTDLWIGLPWILGGPLHDPVDFCDYNHQAAEMFMELVEELRGLYPDKKVYFLNYGVVACAMRAMLSQDMLEPDVDMVMCRTNEPNCLFRDNIPGHQGPMLQDMSALVWLHLLTGVDPSSVLTDWDPEAVETITTVAINANAEYNGIYLN